MSRGIGGTAKIVMQDDIAVMYEYSCYNWNDPLHYNDDKIADGTILIEKDSFVEPEIHEKLKRMPSGRKRQVSKKILADVDYSDLFRKGKIKVENCSYFWSTYDVGFPIDRIAMHLIFTIFKQYQVEGEIPEIVGYHV